MKKKLGAVLSFVVLAICSVFFMPAFGKSKGVASAADDYNTNYESRCLYDGTNYYLSDVVGGYANGYGRYAKGEAVNMTATAADGFELVGWKIVYEDDGSEQIVKNDGAQSSFKVLDPNYESEYKMTFALSFDTEGTCDNGSLTIDTAKVDMTISPVFSYIYYNVVIENFDFTDMKEEIGENTYLYFTDKNDDSEPTEYQNAVIEISGKYNYFGTLYSDGTKYYTIHDKNESGQSKQTQVDYTLGAYRLGDEVDLGLALNESSLVDVTGVYVSITGNRKNLTATDGALAIDRYKLVKHATNKNTESISAKFVIDKNYIDSELNTYFNIAFDRLYKVTYDFYIDNQPLEDNYILAQGVEIEELRSLFLNNIVMNNYFSKYNGENDVYLVKQASASVTCSQIRVMQDDGQTYSYYEYDGENNPILLYGINSDRTLRIDYSSVSYNVTFNYILEDGTVLDESKHFVLPETSQNLDLFRGMGQTIDAEDIYNSTGFRYLNTFIDDDVDSAKNLSTDEISIKIDRDKPKDIVVNMVYEYIEYIVSLVQADNSITFNGIYPLLSATLNVARDDINSSSTLTYETVAESKEEDFENYYQIKNNVMTKSTSIPGNVYSDSQPYYINKVYNNEFELKIRIGDFINISASVTSPETFVYKGYKLLGGATRTSNIEFNHEIIEDLDTEKLTLYSVEEFNYYDMIYKIDYRDDVLMAQIGLDEAGLEKEYYSQVVSSDEEDFANYYEIKDRVMTKSDSIESAEYDENKTYYISDNVNYNLIVIKGLKYRQVLVLNATGIFHDEDGTENDYYYAFIAFEKGGRLFRESSKTEGTPVVYKINVGVEGNDIVSVIYSEPTTTFAIELNNENANNSGLYKVQYNNGGGYVDFDTDASDGYYFDNALKIYYVTAGTIVKISINDENVKFGYKYAGITWSDGSNVAEKELSGTNHYAATLNFDLINYKMTVYQNGAGFTNKIYDFDPNMDGAQPISLNVENLDADMTIPEFYYVSSVVANDISADQLCQTNEIIKYDYSLDFSDNLDLFKNIVNGISENAEGDIVFNAYITYTLHTTNIDIMYGLNAVESVQKIIFNMFPALTDNNDEIDGIFITDRGQRIGYRFKDVPFNSTFVVTIASLVEGLEFQDGTTTGRTITYSNIGSGWLKEDGSVQNVITDEESLNLILTKYSVEFDMSYVGDRPNENIDGIIYTTDNNQAIANPTGSTEATLYGSLNFNSNANVGNGINFDSMYYFSRSSVDSEEFATIYETLYIYDSGEFKLNESDTFDENETYYNKVEIGSYNFSTPDFTPARFGVIDKKIKVFVAYKDYLFNLNFKAEENDGTTTLNFDPINLLPDDYADISIIANNNVPADGKLKFNDSVILSVKLKEEPYKLTNGVVLNKIRFGNVYNYAPSLFENYEYIKVMEFDSGTTYYKIVGNKLELATETEPNENTAYFIEQKGSYIVYFVIDEDVSKLIDSSKDVINAKLTYEVQEKKISLITNIEDLSFFGGDDSMYLQIVDYKENKEETHDNFSIGNDHAVFLSESILSFGFKGGYGKYFQVKDYIITYIVDGQSPVEIDKEMKSLYGIEEITSEGMFSGLKVRHCVEGKISVKFIVAPIIYLHEDRYDEANNIYVYERTYLDQYDSNTGKWIGQPNLLTIGNGNGFNIDTDRFISQQMTITYYDSSFNKVDYPTNVGTYTVKIELSKDGWWSYMSFDEQINLVIMPKEITIYYNESIRYFGKTYDGNSKIDTVGGQNREIMLDNLILIKDYNALDKGLSFLDWSIDENKLSFKIGSIDPITGEFKEEFRASNNLYVIKVDGIELEEGNLYNRNYKLSSTNFFTKPIFKINQKDVYIDGIKIYDKVYNKNENATYYLPNGLPQLNGILDQDKNTTNFSINFEQGIYTFADDSVGANKRIIVDLSYAISGEMSDCYNVIAPSDLTASIYPYSVEAEVPGFGKITIINKRGLADCTNQEMVRLIPIDTIDNETKLVVKEIKYETERYFEIYNNIASFLTQKKYNTGFGLVLSANNVDTILSNYLYLSIPQTNKSQTILYSTANHADILDFEEVDGQLLFDLSKNTDLLKAIVILNNRTYLNSWQISLIVIGVVLLIGAGLTVFFVIRNKKKKQYRESDKI